MKCVTGSYAFGRIYRAKNALLVLLSLLLAGPALAAPKRPSECKTVKGQCIGIILTDSGEYWFAEKLITGGTASWEPIRKTRCPSISQKHWYKEDAFDAEYGDYTCIYDSIVDPPLPEGSGKPREIAHYLSTHKLLLTTDVILFAGAMGDAVTTTHCLHIGCVEGNPIIGKHPSDAEVYGIKTSVTAFYIFIDHYWANRFRNRARESVYLFWWTALTGTNFEATYNNVLVADEVSKARAQLMQQVPIH